MTGDWNARQRADPDVAPGMLAHSSHVLGLVVAFTAGGLANPSYPHEVWRCAYTDNNSLSQVLAKYDIKGDTLVEGLPSGVTKSFKIVRNNKYGVIAILATAEAPHRDMPSVSATTVVIEKLSGDFWLTTTVGGQPGMLNQPIHGRCFKP